MIVSSGTPGHAHAYFALSAPVTVAQLERANRRLAQALGGDLASVDAARILRPPSSWNHKHSPPMPVEMIEVDQQRRYDVDQLVDELDGPPLAPPGTGLRGRRTTRTEVDRLLLAIPAVDYVRVIAGVSPNRAGKIHCPFHQDRTASLQLYEDGTWYCYGACHAGGSIFDFAARMWRLETKGQGFLELRARLANEFRWGAPTTG
jgi:hypothetical protein